VRALAAAALVPRVYVDPRHWVVFDDTGPALTRLREAGWRHIIVCNHVPELAQLVQDLGLADFIDEVLTSATVGYEKPHPEMFAIALARAGSPTRHGWSATAPPPISRELNRLVSPRCWCAATPTTQRLTLT
jgi:FMN phosphatase YigB (HAD superfamily)